MIEYLCYPRKKLLEQRVESVNKLKTHIECMNDASYLTENE
jgi:hypothetical protein